MSDRKHLTEFDYLRGFAIIGVVLIHCTGSFWWKQGVEEVNSLVWGNSFLFCFSAFAVPVFVFISGFMLTYTHNQEIPLSVFYRKRLGFILPPYLIFSCIYLLFFLIKGDLSFSNDLVLIIFKFFSASMASHLWFIALIVQFYVLFPYIIRCYFSVSNKKNTLVISFIASVLYSIVAVGVRDILIHYGTSVDADLYKLIDLILDLIFLSYLFFFFLGVYCCNNRQFVFDLTSKGKAVYLIVILVIIVFFRTDLYIEGVFSGEEPAFFLKYLKCITWCVANFIAIVLFYKLSLTLLNWKSLILRILRKIGFYSFGIYLIHVLFIDIIASLLKEISLKSDYGLFYVFLFIFTILSSYYCTVFISNLPIGKYVVGINAQKKSQSITKE